MSEIRIFHTHIEVYPYKKGDKPNVEKIVSVYNPLTKMVTPNGYIIHNETLYLPRGISTTFLSDEFNAIPTTVSKPDPYDRIEYGHPKFGPKSTMQDHAIQFLCGEDDFKYTARYSQLGLNLQTGDGKTYSAVSAILKYKIKAIIITHQNKIKSQWIDSFKSMTTLPINRVIDITGTDAMNIIMDGYMIGDIYLINHQTIESYAKMNGWDSIRKFFEKIKVGIKVIDESHRFMDDTIKIDFFSNCFKTFYLTATYGRSDASHILYKRAFSSLARFGEETINYEEKRKHTNFVITYFTSKPKYGISPSLENFYGFSSTKYIDYELNDTHGELLAVLDHILDKTAHMEGKTLIFSPKIDSVNIIAQHVSEYTGRQVSVLHSKIDKTSGIDYIKNSEVIVSTVRSAGEGLDIKGLRIVICLEPIGSSNLAEQVRGRLREYSEDKDTYMFYVVDTAIHKTMIYVKKILPQMKKTCKEIMNVTVNI